jgi:hypothetical protein
MTAEEAHARTVECPSCHATPGQPCRHPNGTTTAPRSHRYRRRAARRAARRPGNGQAGGTGQPAQATP